MVLVVIEMLLNVAVSRGARTAKPSTLKLYAAELTVRDVAVQVLRVDAEDVARAEASPKIDSAVDARTTLTSDSLESITVSNLKGMQVSCLRFFLKDRREANAEDTANPFAGMMQHAHAEASTVYWPEDYINNSSSQNHRTHDIINFLLSTVRAHMACIHPRILVYRVAGNVVTQKRACLAPEKDVVSDLMHNSVAMCQQNSDAS